MTRTDVFRCQGTVSCTESSPYQTGDADILFATPAGRVVRRLTRAGFNTGPSFNSSGTAVAFSSLRRLPDGTTSRAIGIIDSRTGAVRYLLPPKGDSYGVPVWSPTGDSVVAQVGATADNAHAALVRVFVDGRPRRALAPGIWSSLAWSHDGRTVAGVQLRSEGDHEVADVYSVSSAGGAVRQLTHFSLPAGLSGVGHCKQLPTSIGDVADTAFSPDDTSIAFTTNELSWRSSQFVYDLVTVRTDGTQLHVVRRPNAPVCYGGMTQATEVIHLLGWL